MYEIYQRLLDEKHLKNADISRATGISNMTLSDWKNGKTTPKQDKLQKIADFFGVSIDYLMTGKEPALENYPEQAEMLVKIRNDKDLMSAIEKYYALSDANKQLVIQIVDALSKG